MRKIVLSVLCLLALLAGLSVWRFGASGSRLRPGQEGAGAAPTATVSHLAVTNATAAVKPATGFNANKAAFRLTNTPKTIAELTRTPHAILLGNAFIDTDGKLDLAIPAQLRATDNPGAYIVQARGVIDGHFRAALAAAGAEVVSYIPNNAYLVRLTPGGAGVLAANALVQAVLPYEPYYKLQSSLLGLAVAQQPLPPGTALNLGLFAADAAATEKELVKREFKPIKHDQSAFGPVVTVLAPANWTAVAQISGVQAVELAHERVAANDLARVTLGVAEDTLTGTNYLNLYGSNVLVSVVDSGVDATHPDFTTGGTAATGPGGAPVRVIGATTNDLVDTEGHGTHVAGIIIGNGAMSYYNTTNVGMFAEGSISNADFRGKAPAATVFSIRLGAYSDTDLQQIPARTNALISNNSWGYGGDYEYDLHAASYDAATRDTLPGVTGSQPVMYVFAAGNDGGGNNGGAGGSGDTILSPGTAKNVITVGALEQLRYITNLVTTIKPGKGTNAPTTNTVAWWQLRTDSGSQVAEYSARGNVGIGTEGDFGRFKPDVVAPGTMVVSTRSQQWDKNAYYNPTNIQTTPYIYQVVETNALVYYSVSVPPNAVAVKIGIVPNKYSNPLPTNMLIYVKQASYPTTNSYDFVTSNNMVSIPPDSGGPIVDITSIQNNGFSFAVGNSTNVTVNYDLYVSIYSTNNLGDYYQVLEGMNDSLGGYYRYESGTSMAAPAVSGLLALIVDFFTNTPSLHTLPSPALMKALLINGARTIGNYSYAVTNGINFQGWGLPSIVNSLPLAGLTNVVIGTNSPLFFADQDPVHALATGDSHTYKLTLNTNSDAPYLNLQATLVWTDPPGDPAAAIKLVNNLDLVITNLETGEVYYGNDISPGAGFSQAWDTNALPNLDNINNVENILLPPLLAGTYTVTVIGRSVNVNAVTAHTNNVVQDYALVITCGEGEVSDAIESVTDVGPGLGYLSNPFGDQQITAVTSTNTPLYNQLVGADSPLLGTNTIGLGTNTMWGSTGAITVGQTNQWHFYVVTNNGATSSFTNAAFITFNPYTLSIPRMGVYEDSVANATRLEGDIDMYVSQNSALTNLDPTVLASCLSGVVGSGGKGVSLGQGGTEFVYFTDSAPGQVYYIGIHSPDRMASEYAFLPVFTDQPFSLLDQNGNLVVNGLLLPTPVPDGNNAHPGLANIFALALPLIPNMQVAKVTVTNLNEHQNFGDLFGSLSFGGQYAVLNNHDGLGNTYGTRPLVYDDSRNPVANSRHSDGPGNLVNFRGKPGIGPWILSEMDNSRTLTGQVSQLTLLIQPHRDLRNGIVVTIPPGGWFIDYVDVGAGYTNLTFYGTNLDHPPIIPPVQMFEKLGNEPTLTDYDQTALLNLSPLPTGEFPGNLISVGPPLDMGRYFVGLYNTNTTQSATVYLLATLGRDFSVNDIYNYIAGSPTMLPDDVVTPVPVPNTLTAAGSTISVAATQLVASVNVGLVVHSPRISDYTFTLVSPTGQRSLLMENRGGWDTNGAGQVFVYTNILNTTATGGATPNTNYLAVDPLGGTVPIRYNFYDAADQMTVFAGTNSSDFGTNSGNPFLLWNTGMTNNPPDGLGGNLWESFTVTYAPGFSNITIIMNEFGNPNEGTAWDYTAGAPRTNYQYLMFTDDTNLASVPIKFAEPPFNFAESSTNYTLTDFGLATNGDYHGLTNIYDPYGGWTVPTNLVTINTVFNLASNRFELVTNVVNLSNNLVSVVADKAVAIGGDIGASNYLALAYGTIMRSIATIPGHQYNITFWYRGPGIAGWWRGEGDATDSSSPELNDNNGRLVGRFNYPAGEVGQAFQFEDKGDQFGFGGTNTYVQIPQSPSLDVGKAGGFTIEGWINPTNLVRPQPLVEWLAKVPTNTAVSNLVIQAGPYLNRTTGHFYYLLGATNWLVSETWAQSLGGHLVTVDTANEQNWVFDNFANLGGTNHNLWIGLTNTSANKFIWAGGSTNIAYTNWLTGQPLNCDTEHKYAFIRGATNSPSGLWVLADTNGFVCNSTATNLVYGVAEVDKIQTNGVQFWVSVTNTPGTTNAMFVNSNGCLYANIVDTNFVSHEIWSAPGLLQSNIYQHVALTYHTNSGIAALYLNGTNVATSNLTVFVPKTDGDVLLGRDMTLYTNNYYGGKMDEMSIYARALSFAEISAIYHVSADTTNRLLGKFDATVTPAVGLAEAAVIFGSTSNLIYGVNNQWEQNSYTFTATSNSMPLRITGLQPGILLDSFTVREAPATNLYYFPEQALAALNGASAFGDWTLQVWDNRVGAYATNVNELVNWQLSLVLQSNALVAATLQPQTPTPSTVAPGRTVYYAVDVPSWAKFATNILRSSTVPADLLFNPTNVPSGANPGGLTLLTASIAGVGGPDLSVNQPSPLLSGQAGSTYYLGVRNTNAHAAAIVLEVDYDMVALTNDVPYTNTLFATNSVHYYSFDVSTNAYEATFQLLQLSGNADLVVRKGVPLPTLTNSDYGSFNTTNADENIYVLTNSSPVPLTAGHWYLGVWKRDSGAVNYTVLAKELDVTNSITNYAVIDLTNGVPRTFTAGPGAALTNFFRFHATNEIVTTATNTVTNYVQGIRFELYNASGDGDLTVQTNAVPLSPPFFQASQNPGRNAEMILVQTNSALTNLAADWYLGVPNNEDLPITYTILAVIETNSYFPAFPGAAGAGGGAWGGRGGSIYHVTTTADSGPGSLRAAVSAPNRTVVFDISGDIGLTSGPLVITNSYLTIAGQTAPGGGITVAGDMTTLQSAHEVVIRHVRLRPGSPVSSTRVTWFNDFEAAPAGSYAATNAPAFDTWTTISNQVTVIADNALANTGTHLLALANGAISNTLSTVPGRTYKLTYAYRGPGAVGLWQGNNSPNDAIYGNNGTVQSVNYTGGKVNQAFACDPEIYGGNTRVHVPDQPIFQLTNSLTIEGWVRPRGDGYVVFWRGDSRGGYDPYALSMQGNNQIAFQISDPSNNGVSILATLAYNQWWHIAGTFDGNNGSMKLYTNGVLANQTTTILRPMGSLIAGLDPSVCIGNVNTANTFPYYGDIDEISLYSRALSASEIQAISKLGSAGKYNASAPTIAQGLAEAQVTLNGISQPVFYGNNTNWQTTNITFIATQANTPLQIAGIEPGMLLDAFTLTDMGATNGISTDAMQFLNASNVIADHISASWSSNNLVSVLNSSNLTVQWSIMADSLSSGTACSGYTNNGVGSLLRYGNGTLSFHHNLYADNNSGSPRLGDNLTLDFVNNVIYNWGLFAGLSGGTNDLLYNPSGFTNRLNYACNYLIAGPDTASFGTNYAITNIAFFGTTNNGLGQSWIFQTNNFIDWNTNRILDGGDTKWAMFTNDYTPFGRPFPLPNVPTDEAFLAYERVLDFAGLNLNKRDSVDAGIVTGVRSQTGSFFAATPLSGMMEWWKGESNTLEAVNNNNGTIFGGVTYTNGVVGKAFKFDGTSGYIAVPSSASLDIGATGSGITIECWTKPNNDSGLGIPMVEWDSPTQAGLHFWDESGHTIFANIVDTANVSHVIMSPNNVINTNIFQHVAITYDKCTGVALLYVNGVVVAAQNFGNVTPQTTYPLNIGKRSAAILGSGRLYGGLLDEVSLYNRALSATELQAIYNAGSAGKFANLASPLPYLDTDQDGLPDFWEKTFTTNLVFTPSNNNDRDGDGYTDLEEYNNWLAAPHALTVTTNPVAVDLVQLCGKTGNLSFSVTNGVHGFVYLTNVLGSVTNTGPFSNSIAIFTPTNNAAAATNYNGYAAFDFFVTNNDTVASFGPVTVSVLASAVPVVLNTNFPPVIIPLTNKVPYANTNFGGSDFYKFTVTNNLAGNNAIAALFNVTNASGPVVLVAGYGLPLPSLSSYDYLTNRNWATTENILVLTNSMPVPLTNGDWYLAVVNVSGSNVSYKVTATLWYAIGAPVFTYPTNNVSFTNLETVPLAVPCAATDTNVPPLPLTFTLLTQPANVSWETNVMTIDPTTGLIKWTPNEVQGPSSNSVSVKVSNGAFAVTNTFSIIVLESNLPPVFERTNILDQIAFAGNLFTFTNAATDADIPTNVLAYTLLTPTNGAVIDTNGVITWVPTLANVNTTNVFTTVVTDTNPVAVNTKSFSVTNQFNVIVPPLPNLTNTQTITNTVFGGGIAYYQVTVPTNATFATNQLLFATNQPVNLLFNQTNLPTGTGWGDVTLLLNSTGGSHVLRTNTAPPLRPGLTYYLGVQNTNSLPVTFALQVDFHLVEIKSVPIASIVQTNIGGTNGFLLTWFAPTNYLFQVQWKGNLLSTNWLTFSNLVGYDLYMSPTNSRFTFFDDGAQTSGFGLTRFYRLNFFGFVLPSNAPPVLPPQADHYLAPLSTLTVTNAASDADLPDQTLTYSLVSPPVGMTMDTNGVIHWIPTLAQAGTTNTVLTTVTDNGVPSRSATNSFAVIVYPIPGFSSAVILTNGVSLQWTGLTNEQFQMEWATNLAPVVWFPFTNIFTSVSGTFSFTDTNTPLVMKFYRLLLLP